MNTDFDSDIPAALAVSAYSGVSFDPEARGSRARQDYTATLADAYASFSEHADTEEKKAILDTEFARYRAGMARRYRAFLASSARCVSSFIAGPSNFPAARMNKRADITHKRLAEFLHYDEAARAAIIRKLHPDWRPIMKGDDDALERLNVKLAQAEQLQASMKDANAVIRHYSKEGKERQFQALLAVGFSTSQATKLLVPDCFGFLGYAPFHLTNNGANIRRMKMRLASISRCKATPNSSAEGSAARVEDCPSENRVKLFFPGKPDEAIRARLKSGGFRWAPSEGSWKAYRHDHTINLAREIAGIAA
jgi:hypothetical protein